MAEVKFFYRSRPKKGRVARVLWRKPLETVRTRVCRECQEIIVRVWHPLRKSWAWVSFSSARGRKEWDGSNIFSSRDHTRHWHPPRLKKERRKSPVESLLDTF